MRKKKHYHCFSDTRQSMTFLHELNDRLTTRSRKANSSLASQEIPRILCNPKVHYRIHNIPLSVPILSQLDLVHAPTSHFSKIHFNIIPLSMAGSSQWLPSLMFSHQIPVCTSPLPHTCDMSCPSHSCSFHHPNNIS
jgi:hypothetical protein